MNAFSKDYTPYKLATDKPARKVCTPKAKPNPFDGNDARARMACVRLPKTHPNSRADLIRGANSKV